MASGCKDCGTCTRPGAARWGQWWAVALLHVCTCGISYWVKRSFMRHCPQCRHLLSGHQRTADGAFAA